MQVIEIQHVQSGGTKCVLCPDHYMVSVHDYVEIEGYPGLRLRVVGIYPKEHPHDPTSRLKGARYHEETSNNTHRRIP